MVRAGIRQEHIQQARTAASGQRMPGSVATSAVKETALAASAGGGADTATARLTGMTDPALPDFHERL